MQYMTGEIATFYGGDHSNKGKKKQPQMPLELYIDKVAVRNLSLLF